MASFFIVVVFLPHNWYRCKLRSTGRLSARARSNRRHSGEASKTMDYKTVFINLCLVLQQNWSWIKGLGKKSIHSFHSVHPFPDGSAFCPGAPKRVPSDSEKHRRVYTSSNVCHSHEWRVDTASGLTLKKQNACLHAVRHAVGKKNSVYTRPPKRRG